MDYLVFVDAWMCGNYREVIDLVNSLERHSAGKFNFIECRVQHDLFDGKESVIGLNSKERYSGIEEIKRFVERIKQEHN